MAEVTEADREKALAAIKASSPEVYVDKFVIDGDLPPLVETVAAALAEEREKAFEHGCLVGMTTALEHKSRLAEENP
jgi:hypothetical protein